MIEYIKLCSPKIPRALGICFIIFYLTCFALLVALAFSKNMFEEFLDPTALLVYLPGFCFALAVMVIVLAVLSGYFEFKLQRKVFQTPPFNQLSKIGFHHIELLKKNISRLYYEGEIAKINGFITIVTLHTKTQVCFTILCTGYANVPLDLSRMSKEAEVSSNSNGITVIFPFESFWTPSLQQIGDALKSVTETMANHGCIPITSIRRFENNVATDLVMRGLGQ